MGTSTQPQRHLAATITDNGISFFLDGKSYVVNREHPGYDAVIKAIREKDYDAIPALMDVNEAMDRYFSTNDPDFEVKGALVYYKGKPFTDEVSEKVLSMTSAGLPAEPLANFLKKLRKNPSATAQRETLLFAVANGFLIHEDGDIIAYKAVREDYLDVHSRTVLNKPAHILTDAEKAALPSTTALGVTVSIKDGLTVISMERSDVDDNRDRTCSVGLHFAAHSYARSFTGGPRMMVLKLSPADVVSIPSDYNNAKGRCAEYSILAEIEDEYIKESGMAHREVFRDEDFRGDGFSYGGCGGSTDDEGDDDLDGGDDEQEDEGPEGGDDESRFKERVTAKVTEVLADLSPSHYQREVQDDLSLTLKEMDVNPDTASDEVQSEYGLEFRPTFSDSTTVEAIINVVVWGVDTEGLVNTLKEKIVTREVYDTITFRNIVQAEGYDPDNGAVVAALTENGLHRWL
jgi:hypothetical protein